MRRLGKQPECREATDGLIRRRLSEQHGSHAKPAPWGTQKEGMTFPQDLYLTRDRDHRFQRGNPTFEQTEDGLRAGAARKDQVLQFQGLTQTGLAGKVLAGGWWRTWDIKTMPALKHLQVGVTLRLLLQPGSRDNLRPPWPPISSSGRQR